MLWNAFCIQSGICKMNSLDTSWNSNSCGYFVVMGRVDKCRVRVGFGFWNFFRARVGSGFEIVLRVFYYTIFPKFRVFSGFRVGFALFRVRVGFGLVKNPRVGFSGFRVPDPSLLQTIEKVNYFWLGQIFFWFGLKLNQRNKEDSWNFPKENINAALCRTFLNKFFVRDTITKLSHAK